MNTHNDADRDISKEELILSAAMDIFIEKGWSGARMQEIADRAGINKALLHYYFRSKENLYDRIIETVFGIFFLQIETALTDAGTFDEVLRRFIGTIVDTISAHPRIPQFIVHELAQGGKNVKYILTSVAGRYGLTLPQRLVALVAEEVKAGRIRRVDPPQLIITLLGACIYYFVAEPMVEAIVPHVQPDSVYDRERFLSDRKESIVDVIYFGLKTRT